MGKVYSSEVSRRLMWPTASMSWLPGAQARGQRQLFLAGSWDIMTASILEILFTAREIARFGGKQQAVLISSQCTVTTVTRIYRHHEAENSSRHFVPYLEHAQAPPPFTQPIKTVCPAEPTVYMGIFIFPEYTHSIAIYKHRLATAGAGPRVPSASRGDI